MNIRKKILTRCGALLTAVLVLAPTALAAEAEIPYIPQTVPAAQLAPADQRGQEDWQLLLVNPWHTVPEGYEIKLATLSNGLQVDERIYDDLDDMLSDCREADLNPIVCSAYRTEATQTRLYRNKVARVRASGVPGGPDGGGGRRWVAKPGTSEHQTGLALDIVAAGYQILDEEQEDTAEQKWLMENSWKYGFILRYPSEKSDITGIGYEPWHYRYVGKAAAADIYRTGRLPGGVSEPGGAGGGAGACADNPAGGPGIRLYGDRAAGGGGHLKLHPHTRRGNPPCIFSLNSYLTNRIFCEITIP